MFPLFERATFQKKSKKEIAIPLREIEGDQTAPGGSGTRRHLDERFILRLLASERVRKW